MHRLLDDVCHLRERTFVFAESLVDNLVGGIDDARHVAAPLDGFEGEGKATKLVGVWLKELQGMCEKVEPLAIEWQTVGVGERILDG